MTSSQSSKYFIKNINHFFVFIKFFYSNLFYIISCNNKIDAFVLPTYNPVNSE